MTLKLDSEWVLSGQPRGHIEAPFHDVIVATESEREYALQCSCGFTWFRPKLKVANKEKGTT